MPTPVKNAFPAAAPAPAKAGRGASADGAESFQDELVRRRGADAANAAAKPQAAKAEPKRPGKSGKGLRGERGGPPDAEEPQVRAAPEGRSGAEAAADVEGPPEADTVDAPDSAAVDERADDPGEDDSQVDPAAAAALVSPLAPSQAPTAETNDASPADGASVSSDDEPGDAAAVAAGRLATRPAVYAAQGPAGAAVAPDATSDDSAASAAPADGTAGLFAEAIAPADGDSDPGQEEGARREPGGAAAEAAGPSDGVTAEAAETLAEFEIRASAGDGRSASAGTANPDGLAAAATAGVSEIKPEARAGGAASPAGPVAPAVPPEARFAAANHEAIVTSMRGELMPKGGTMRIRLDPPQLGALQVTVQIQDGVVTASFETSNDEATRLLGHSLNQLKTTLESHGVAVDKLQVQQAPRETQANQAHDDGRREQGSQSQEQEQQARQEQQRREMLKRMWRRLSGGQDPLDLTA